MCLVMPSRVLSVSGQQAEIEMPNGVRARVDTTLTPELAVGAYVLVDRGLVLKVIEPAEAEAILAMYAELGDLAEEPEVDPVAVWAGEAPP
jgi:hydrogenase assembly chaperone HypC/HupF